MCGRFVHTSTAGSTSMALTRAAAAKMVRRIDLICILGIWVGFDLFVGGLMVW